MAHDTWRLLIDEPASGATNMACDEALAIVQATGAVPPTLRLYRWQPACLSLGRFQRSGDVDRAACERAGVMIVRRPSGGRALLHDDELTYALIARIDHPLFARDGSILGDYHRISLALLTGLRRLCSEVVLTAAGRQRSGGSAACFDTPAAYELTVRDRKLVGSAQARRQSVLLQHGALPLAPHADRLAALLAAPPADLGMRMITLGEALGRPIGFAEVASAVVSGFEEAWGITFERGALSAEERALTERLRAEKYTQNIWTYAR